MSATVESAPFDVCGPLPTGTTVLEASAGTGKTFAIAALAARYVAEGTPLDRLLLVTFTRMATGELRERVRERLVSTERGLARALAGAPPNGGDEAVVDLLAQGSREEVAARRERLARALADFDSATIATTHGFCQEVLNGLGVTGDVDPDTTFVDDLGDLVEEVVDDLFVRRFHPRERPRLRRKQALAVGKKAVENPTEPIEPRDVDEHSDEAMRVRLAEAVREELESRKRRAAVMSYDDLLVRLDRALAGPGGDAAAERLRERYRVVLVDEFQDTDRVQWRILARAFGSGAATLVLIGDPKQAIYAFRGADVYAYLEAARTAGTRATLRTNYRSDQGLIDAYDALFGGAKLGHEGIVYRRVEAAGANRSPRLSGAPVTTPLRMRWVDRGAPSVGTTQKGYARLDPARQHVASDLAGDLVALLSSVAEVEVRAAEGAPLRREPVRPGHVAVLVRTHRIAGQVRDALDEVGVPAVINGAGSVFATDPARDWLRLLEAIERPTHALRAHAVALTSFVGWSAERVASAGEEDWEAVHRRLHHWARVLRVRGVASLVETIALTQGVAARELATSDGERRLTDLRHVGQLLHTEAAREGMGATALASWLRVRIEEAHADTGDEERSRRLESDDEAVQVLTIHRSKGLEFPVVYYPDLWQPGWIPDGEPIFFHDPDSGDARTIDVGLGGPRWRGHKEQHEREQRGEDLRLAYVALTRAQHQAVVWWAGSWDSRNSALGRLLFSRDEEGNVPATDWSVPSDADALARFEALAGDAPGCVSVERSAWGAPARWAGSPAEAVALDAASFDRSLDRSWRRTSYSAITAGTHDAGVGAAEVRVGSEPEDTAVADEPADASPPGAPAPDEDRSALREVPSLLAGTPVGLEVGTFVHRVLEAADFAAEDIDAELTARVASVRGRREADVGDPAAVVAGLRAMLETPLGPLADGARLRDVARPDRLDELDFELPLAGGDSAAGSSFSVASIAAVLSQHVAPGDPLWGYAERLSDPGLARVVRGYLTGSIDLVVRLGSGAGGTPRFAVVDYKTNWLALPGEPLSPWHHRPAALAAEMRRFHYGLQALLYTVALHRYLRWRLPGYDPEANLAGVLYLFVRGMSGADTPVVDGAPCGVFAWRPSRALVEDLSDVLDRGRAE